MGKKWLPLEANPDVMNAFAHNLGLPKEVAFHDIYGFDADLLAMVPQPVLAVLMLFPITAPTSEKAKDDEAAKIAAEGQTQSDKVYYMRQTVGNACGTVGILHAVGNNLERFGIAPGSYFNEFFAKTASLTPAERATYLEEDEGIEVAHGDAVVGGQSSVPDIDAVINLHFVALVCVDGGLYELDGRKSLPVYHGVTSEATLLTDAVPVINTFVENAEGSIHFNAIALSKSVE